MDTFARESFKLGTLRGFKHFTAELRGREEMLLSIKVPSSARGRLLLEPRGSRMHCHLHRPASASANLHRGKRAALHPPSRPSPSRLPI